MRALLAVVAATVVLRGGGAQASTAETQARLAAARPVATRAVAAPSPPVTANAPTVRPTPIAAPPKPNLPASEAPTPKPEKRRDLGLILLLPALIALVALVRWFARRRRSGSTRV